MSRKITFHYERNVTDTSSPNCLMVVFKTNSSWVVISLEMLLHEFLGVGVFVSLLNNSNESVLLQSKINLNDAGVAQELSLRNLLHVSEKSCKPRIHSGCETQGKHHQKLKTGVSVA